MSGWLTVLVVVAVLVLVGALSVRIVQQYEKGVLFRLGRVVGVREPGLRLIVPLIEVLRRVSLRIVTMPIQSQGIITRDNVSIDVSAVAYYRVVDATKSVVAIENVAAAINQIAQTTLRKVVGQHTLDETLAETDQININIREILDVATEEWGVVVTLVELKDIQLPETMKRAMARQAEAEREKRAKIIAAEGESLAADQLGAASDVMMAHPLALQLRNLQSLVEIGVDKNTTVVFPAPLMSTIQELGAFLAREQAAGTTPTPAPTPQPQRPLPRPHRLRPPRPPSRYRRPRQSSTPTTKDRPPPVREGTQRQPRRRPERFFHATLPAVPIGPGHHHLRSVPDRHLHQLQRPLDPRRHPAADDQPGPRTHTVRLGPRALALGPRTLAHGPQSLLARPAPNHHPHVRSHRDTGPLLPERTSHGDPLPARAASP